MFEFQGRLRTWALEREPEWDQSIPAVPLADHRLAYLDYEGEISGDRGRVERCDQGEYTSEVWSTEIVVVRLSGGRMAGRVQLQATAVYSELGSHDSTETEPAHAPSWIAHFSRA